MYLAFYCFECYQESTIHQLIDDYTKKQNDFEGGCEQLARDIKKDNIGTYLAILKGIEQDLLDKVH